MQYFSSGIDDEQLFLVFAHLTAGLRPLISTGVEVLRKLLPGRGIIDFPMLKSQNL